MINLGLGFIIGTLLGSLSLCIADRSLSDQSFWGRSYCPNCQKQLRWYDLFPVLSYLFLKRHCRFCHKKIGLEYPLAEILVGLITAYLFFLYLPNNWANLSSISGSLILANLIFKIFIVSVLTSILITDLKQGLIPDRITYPSIVIAVLFLIISSALKISLLYLNLSSNPIGKYLLPPHTSYFYNHAFLELAPLIDGLKAAFILAMFFGLLILVTRGRGMGGGDFKFSIFMGLILGTQNSLLALFLAFVLGSVVGIVLILLKKKNFGQTIPFGPFLVLGSLIALFFGTPIINWYSHVLSVNGSIFS